MTRLAPSVAQAQSSIQSAVAAAPAVRPTRGWPALLVAGAVFGAAMYSFAPRPAPIFPDTRLHADEVLVSGLATNGHRYVGVGEQGHVLIADAPQGPWRDARVQPQRGSALTQVQFLSDTLALAVGHDSWILRSTDGGASWKEVFYDDQVDTAAPLLGLAGPYDGKVFAFGAFGQLLVSVDQGADQGVQWRKLSNDAIGDRHFYGMAQAGDGALWLVGEQGTMLRSGDGGETWLAQPQIYTGSFFGILTLPDKALLAFGMRGKVFRSEDAGKTWQASTVPAEISLFGGALTPKGEVALAGSGNSVFLSTDDGRTFAQVSAGNRHDLAAVLPLADGRYLTAGDGGIHLDAARPAK